MPELAINTLIKIILILLVIVVVSVSVFIFWKNYIKPHLEFLDKHVLDIVIMITKKRELVVRRY